MTAELPMEAGPLIHGCRLSLPMHHTACKWQNLRLSLVLLCVLDIPRARRIDLDIYLPFYLTRSTLLLIYIYTDDSRMCVDALSKDNCSLYFKN